MSKEPKRNVYVGHRYVPKIMGEWDKAETYEGLSIVTNKGTSYTSKKRVPVGIDILDEEYWVVTGNYNAQIEEYRKDVSELEKEVDKKADQTSLNEFKTNIDNQISSFKNEINGDFTNFSNSINQQIEEFEEKNNTNLTEFKENINNNLLTINTNISNLEESKKQKEESNLYISDYEKEINETDDQFINRLLSYLPENKGTLHLDGKTYELTDSIILNEYQTLKGVGRSTHLKMDNDKDIIKIIDVETNKFAYGIKIEDLSITGNNENIGINLNESTHITINDVYIYETKIGIKGNTWLANYNRVTIRNYNKMGSIGFNITGGTSNILNNVWVKNFELGYDMASIYSNLNSCACDTFRTGAYYTRQATTLNSCGAEDGTLKNEGYVFKAGARSIVYNACETMNIKQEEGIEKASIFNFNGSHVTVNNYSHHGSLKLPDKISLYYVQKATYLLTTTERIAAGYDGEKYVFDENARASTIQENYKDKLSFHRWNGEKILHPIQE